MCGYYLHLSILRINFPRYENGRFLRNVTASYVVFEMNGRTDYSYFATMAQVYIGLISFKKDFNLNIVPWLFLNGFNENLGWLSS